MLQEVDFRCCQDPECDLVARRLIADFSEILRSMDDLGRVSALILTGSFARGEGSILKLNDQSYKVLGDIEFLAVIGKRSGLEFFRKSVIKAKEVFDETLKKRRVLCKVEVTPALPRFFKRLRPRIFDYELIRHGKTIWGDRIYLENIPRFSPKQISKIDPIYLLFNRIIEQLALLLEIKDGEENNLLEGSYQIGKVYIDLATSILAYTGNFEDTYLNRSKRFNELISSHALENEEWFRDHIQEKVSCWTDAKLRPRLETFMPGGIIDQTKLLAKWAQLAEMVKNVLRWEICNYLHLDQSADLKQVLWSFSKSFKLTHRVKEWIKFHINSRVPSNEKSILRTLRLFGKGSPRSLIYFCSAMVYFSLRDEIAKGGNLDNWKGEPLIRAFIPTGFGRNETSPFDMIRQLLRDWVLYLRNN